MVDIESILISHQRFQMYKIVFIVSYVNSMLLFLHNFIKFSSSFGISCNIAIVYIVMNKGKINDF